MSASVYRIHPTIGIARVGNSREFHLAPETLAGLPLPGDEKTTGGLPIRAGTEADPIRGADVRDSNGARKRQAARFRIYHYPAGGMESYPNGGGVEVRIGSTVDGKVVRDIRWTVHVANKKANTFQLAEDPTEPQGIQSFQDGRLPEIRNASTLDPKAKQPPVERRVAVLDDPSRVKALTIDPGPRAISGRSAAAIHFDRATPASYCDDRGEIVPLANYPKTFPEDAFPGRLQAPIGDIDTLGEIQTDEHGRLIFAGGYGRAVAWSVDGRPIPLTAPVNNDQWFDDASDGPVSAVLVFDDGCKASVFGAWVTATDPGTAPQILNIVSLWDDIYDIWVREMGLAPQLYDPTRGAFREDYRPTFEDQVFPIFRSAVLQQWVTNMSSFARSAHVSVDAIKATDPPSSTPLAGLFTIFRNPNDEAQFSNTRLMPLALGDGTEPMLALRKTQYFFLQRWISGFDGFSPGRGPALGGGELLDKASLFACLGGRFSPGIDLTFIIRDPALYIDRWQTSGAGPFRINGKRLSYAGADADKPFLSGGYVPMHNGRDGLEPGDVSKFMALPWHTDYNSCATHPPSPNPAGNKTLFWSWPAQRPVAVFPAAEVTQLEPSVVDGEQGKAELGPQRWSVRGLGTDSPLAQNWGRFQPPILNFILNWSRVGVVLQSTAIDHPEGVTPDPTWYLETQSQLLDTEQTPVVPFPNTMTYDPNDDPETGSDFDERELFHKLLNIEAYPEILPEAKAFVDTWLTWAEGISNDPTDTPADTLYFPYTPQAFQDRLDMVYQELVDQAATYDAGEDPTIKSRADMITRIVQFAPFNLTDGSWLRNIGRTGPIDEVRALIYSVLMDELGDGDISKNHCNLYLDLCHSIGYYPDAIESSAFAYDPTILQSAFTLPAFQLAASQFSDSYYPELLGMTLNLEWSVVGLKPARDLAVYYGIDPHFYILHIGIDNAANGHGQRAADAIRLYLEKAFLMGGDEEVQRLWRRIWNGYVAFGNAGTFGQDLQDMIENKPTLRDQMIAMIERKAKYGRSNHQTKMLGPSRIDEWFARPKEFLDALSTYGVITPGDWENSRMRGLISFETGPMFRVFTDAEIALWTSYTNALKSPGPGPIQPLPPSDAAMFALVNQLRPMQQGTSGHQTNMMADEKGEVHTLAWWFEQPTIALMRALASPLNGLVIPGDPENSRFFAQLVAPTGPMGSVFGLPSKASPTETCRAVVGRWIEDGCLIPARYTKALLLTSPIRARMLHRTGKIRGMGAVH